jgi:hypothetical protein
MKMTRADHIGKSREEIRQEIIRKSVEFMGSNLSDGERKRFMTLDKDGQKKFVTAAMSAAAAGRRAG